MKRKKMKIILPVILLVALAAVGAFGVLWGLNRNEPDKTEGLKEMPKAEAADEETLRQLLLEESVRTIAVDRDIEVDTQFLVKGKKTLIGDGELRMALRAEWGQALLMISEDASLTMDGLVLNGNYVADGIHMEKSGELTYLSGTIQRTDSYGIWAQGKVTVKDIKIDSADYIAVFAQKGSQVAIEGGTLSNTATNDVYVEKGATVNITGAPTMEGCTGDALVNYGTLNVSGGTYTGANSYTFNNYGDLTVVSEGEGVRCSGSRLGVICTRKGAKTTLSGVHIYDTERQAVVTVGGNTKITNCTFERTGYHSIEIQTGKADIENVTIKESQNSGIECYTDAAVTIQGLWVDGCDGIGIASRGAKVTGDDIKITGAKKYGISCGNSKNGKGSAVITNATITDTEKSSFYVYNDASMELENVQASGTKSRGIYVAKGASCTLSGESTIRNAEYRGVEVRGTLVMNDGKVFDNNVENSGAGVYVAEAGDFTMNGGSIYDNASQLRGGGICVTDDGKVTINNGDVYHNTSQNNGGGLYAQKNAVVTLKSGSIRENHSEAYGDGIHIASAATKVTLGDQFYMGKNDIKIDNVETSLQITGSSLAKHSASDPLLLTPNYSAKEGTVIASCKNERIAKSLAVKVGSGDGSYEIVRDRKNFAIAYGTADMDMTGADTVYVSDFSEMKAAVMGTTSKRYIVLKANIAMKERLRFPGGVTIAIKDDGTKRVITRADGYGGNLFVTHYGTGLYLEATEPGNLVLDGTHSAGVDGKKVQSLVRTAGSTVFRNVTLENNGVLDEDSTVRGALFRQLYGDFKIYHSVLRNARCSSGGAVMLDKGTGYIEGSTFNGNQSVIGGGALRAAANTGLEIKDSEFAGNQAGTAGGAFVAVGGANVTVTNTRFTDNTAANYGGAISVQDEGTVLTLQGTDPKTAVFADNSAKTIGAVCVHMGAKLNASGYCFENNEATEGRAGALAVNNGGSARMENTTFYKNRARGSGGALSIDKSSLEAISCDFGKENAGNVSGDKGGAILVTGEGSLIMDVTRDGLYHGLGYNQAAIGGAVCVYGGKAEIRQYTVKGNRANDGGGGIYVNKGSSAVCMNAEFAENIAAKETEKGVAYSNGGAVQVLGTFTDSDSAYTGNVGRNGGALIVMTDGKAVLTGSGQSPLFKMLKMAEDKAVLTGSGQSPLFKDNTAAGNGGAVFVNIGGTLETEGYQFEANHAKAGGAVYAQKDAKSVAITGAVMKSNEAMQGGAVYANGKGLIVTGSKFEENRAAHETAEAGVDGGAIYANTDSDVAVKQCQFLKNTGKTGAGAIFITQGATVTCESSTFTENTSPGNGGAVHCKGTYRDIDSAYNGNASARNGGALIVMTDGKAVLTGSSQSALFKENTAAGNGGAVFVNIGGTLETEGYQFEANHAKAGGAIYAQKDAKSVAITGAVMKSNEAVQGGAVFANGKGLVITGSKFEENRADHETAEAGVDGGAIYANTDSDVAVKQCEFTKNTGKTSAGAIFILQNATVTCENSAFTENTSPGNGGAVHCKGTYQDTNSTYTKNTGKNGGAIIAINGGSVTLAGAEAKFIGNQATVRGNAIFIQGDKSQASVSGYAFEGDPVQTVQVNGSLTFDNITGATLVKGGKGILWVAGYQKGNQVTVTPDLYKKGTVILTKADTMTQEDFQAACQGITLTPDSGGTAWVIDENGKEQNPGATETYVARIEDEEYETLEEAVAAAKDNDVIYVLDNVVIGNQITISKKVTITNEPGKEVTIGRNADKLMFEVNSGAKLTLGSNSEDGGQLIVDGGGAVAPKTRIINSKTGAEFVLGRNATLQNADNNQWGSALINSGTAELYGTVKDNTCSGAGGAILQNDGKLTIVEGTYTGNSSTRKASGSTTASYGGAIRVQKGALEIQGGTFQDNSTTGQGGAVWVNAGAALSLFGGTFVDNTADGKDSDIYSNVAVEIAGPISGAITFTPGTYQNGQVVLTKGDAVTEEQFQAACAGITIAPDATGKAWTIDGAGKLQTSYVARMENGVLYDTLPEAITEANKNGGTIYVNSDVELGAQMNIKKEITITNEPGKEVTIGRNANRLMFYVESGAKLTLGTNSDDKGQLIVDGGGAVASTTRIVDNRDNATFVLGKNATLQNANNNQWGSALINRKGNVELYGRVINNTCSGDGGAILQHGAGKLTVYGGTYTGNEATNSSKNAWGAVIRVVAGEVEIKDGIFSGNRTVGLGSVLYVASGATATISGGTFSGNTAGQGGAIYNEGTLKIGGPVTDANGITVTLKAEDYKERTTVLTKGDTVTEADFRAACVGITVTPGPDGKVWSIDGTGELSLYEARIGTTYYKTFADAVAAANSAGGTGAAADVVVYVRGDVTLGAGAAINKNMTIRNEAGANATVKRTGNLVMFTVSNGARLTLGTNEGTEQGKFVVDGTTASAVNNRMVQNPAGASFVLGRNAVLQNANVNNWGTALNNAGMADLYGSVVNNTSTAAGGAILQSNAAAKLTIHEGTYTGNHATRPAENKNGVSYGSAIIANGGTVTIEGGTFSNNSTTGRGGVLDVYGKGTTVTISGGTFSGNRAGTNGNAIYITAGASVTITGGEFATASPAQEIYVDGNLTYSGLPDSLIKTGTGTVDKTGSSLTSEDSGVRPVEGEDTERWTD